MNQYYLHRDGQNHGPYTEQQVVQFMSDGSIQANELVCPVGGSEWVAASSIGGSGRASPTNTGLPRRPPKTLFAIVFLGIYAIAFTIGAFVTFSAFSNLTHRVTGEKTGLLPGILLSMLILSFAVAFASIAIGLKKRKSWAYHLGCRFMILNIFSPLFILGIIGWKKLSHQDTLSAFEEAESQ